MSAVAIRAARARDDAALAAIDQATWSSLSSPAPPSRPGSAFLVAQIRLEDVLVAVLGDEVVGYVQLGPATPVDSNGRVLMIRGLAVDPARRGRGIGRRLVDAAVREASARGARRLTLRVLAPTPRPARSTRRPASRSRACCARSSASTGATSTTS